LKNFKNKMSPEKLSPQKEKGISVEKCILKAEKYIKEKGNCLFIYDVKNSKKYSLSDRQKLQEKLLIINNNLTNNFIQYFPENNLRTLVYKDIGPQLIGDGSIVGINNADAIPKIIEYLKENCSEASFHYNVAKDGWDNEGMKTIK